LVIKKAIKKMALNLFMNLALINTIKLLLCHSLVRSAHCSAKLKALKSATQAKLNAYSTAWYKN